MAGITKILVIDDEPALRHVLLTILSTAGYSVDACADTPSALNMLEKNAYSLAISDVRMPGADGMEFLHRALKLAPELCIIMMSAYGTIDSAIACMKQGAFDYISKPFKPDEILLAVKKGLEHRRLRSENTHLRKRLAASTSSPIIHADPSMRALLKQVKTLAQVRSAVLIQGESGTGKELIAKALHQQGSRAAAPFVALNCSAIAANLVESELFGHARGAFTGADKTYPGLFAAADGGTLFLDEIGELPLDFQPKLLRVLQEREVRPVGSTRTVPVDVRIVAATATDLNAAVAAGRFREDLYYRLAVVELNLPALRQRLGDIPILSRHFLELIARQHDEKTPAISADALEALTRHNWPGNVRELRNILEKAMIFRAGGIIEVADLAPEFFHASGTPPCIPSDVSPPNDLSLKHATAELEQRHICAALHQTGGNRTQAAKILEISLRALHYKIQQYELDV
ncbi:MAG: sigma-54 dependent transcriptional regulator [Desulfuromonadaceae bacterium]|nr:sigma-54 dependent transcriptional regulator [Desulfuromonas sp.]MDY0186089.1 sigma-54 dependent transcriptional regulator [Desulfuromonadaceae bacterium]